MVGVGLTLFLFDFSWSILPFFLLFILLFFFFLAGNSLSSQHQEGSAFNNLCMRDEQRSIDSREVDLSDFESVQSG